jgi:hypothetical protein
MRLHSRSLLLASAVAVLGLTGCLNEMTMGKPLPKLDYQHIAPLYIGMGQVDIVNHFHPTAESDKAASAFPTRPENALNHYAENRLKAKGYEGTLQFIIEDASVRHSIAPPDSKVLQMVNVGNQDRYDVSVKITLARIEGNGFQSGNAVIQLNRYVTVPKTDSIAKREKTLKDFVQGMVEEIDGMVATALQDRMHLLLTDNGAPVAGTVNSNQPGPAVPSLPVPSVHPEALPPPW